MMEIVVQVLPSMTKKYSDASSFKEKFIQNYIKMKQEALLEQNQIQIIIIFKKKTFNLLLLKQTIYFLAIQRIENKRLILSGQQIMNEFQDQFTESDLQSKALKIWDQLQNEKYLQKFSLVDKMKKTDLLRIDDAVIVIRALIVKQLTVFDFYLTFVEYYHQQQIKKQQELGKMINYESLMIDLFNFSQQIQQSRNQHKLNTFLKDNQLYNLQKQIKIQKMIGQMLISMILKIMVNIKS